MSATTQSTLADAAKAAKDNVTPLAKTPSRKSAATCPRSATKSEALSSRSARSLKRAERLSPPAQRKSQATLLTVLFDARATTKSLIRKHPLAAIGIAVGVGVIVAAMSRKK